ncbi:MAG: acyl-CoA thioesterase [Sedimentisphaerales bacterium]|nr:acyl-CoA thioesterase [Sedimentisphaerales bacterium]
MSVESKTPRQSAVESRYILMPHQANQYGTAFGGVIVAWIDMVAAMSAQRHCGLEVVTASIDSLHFKEPVYVGEHVILKASVNYVGRTSMEVGVRVLRENPLTGQQSVATTAHLTFVALDRDKRPAEVPALRPETEDEKRRHENAKCRTQARKDLRKRLKPSLE